MSSSDDFNKNSNNKASDKYFSKRPNTQANKSLLKSSVSKSSTNKPPTSRPPQHTRTQETQRNNSPPQKKRKRKHKSGVSKFFGNLLGGKNSPLLLGGFVGALVLIIVVWGFTNKNAYDVYVGEQLMGTIAKNKTITEQTMYDAAVAKLTTEVGSPVKVEETIVFKPVHAKKSALSIADNVVGKIYNTWPYQINASILSVNGVKMAKLDTKEKAQEVLDKIAAQYISKDSKMVGTPTFPGVEIVNEYIKPTEIVSVEAAYEALNKSTESTADYVIQSGDTLYAIAPKVKMTVDELLLANDGYTIETKLKPGQTMKIKVNKPLVSVTTVEEMTTTTVEPMKVETRENPNQYKTYSKLIQQGKDGQKTVVSQITKTNGLEISTKSISEKILIAPVSEITEVGTGQKFVARQS